MKLPLIPTTLLCAFGWLVAATTAQEPETPEKPESKPAAESKPSEEAAEETTDEDDEDKDRWIVIQGADIHVGNGTVIRRGTVITKNDKIEKIGHDLELPEDATLIDASGRVVCPGFVAVRATGFGAPSSFRLEDIAAELNPYDPEIMLGLAVGITSFGMLADGGRDKPKGKSAVIKLTPGDLDGMLLAKDTHVSMNVPLTSTQWKSLRDLVGQTKKYQADLAEFEKKKAAAKPGSKPPKPPRAPRGADTLIKIMDGKTRLWIGSPSRRFGFGAPAMGGYENANIRQAMDVARLLGVGVVLDRPVTGWAIPNEIAATGSMAIIAPRQRVMANPDKPDDTGSNIASARILTETGVGVAVVANEPRLSLDGLLGQDLNTPTVDAAYAVRGGLDNRKALQTITLDSARALGVDSRVGSIEIGKDADILILGGDPLHYATLVETAIVNGKIVYERAKEPFYSHIKR